MIRLAFVEVGGQDRGGRSQDADDGRAVGTRCPPARIVG